MMAKLDDLLKTGKIAEASGTGTRGMSTINAVAPPMIARLEGVARIKNAMDVPVANIVRDESQPREDFDEESLLRLSESIKGRGVLQPIRLRWDEGSSKYIVVAGERRWRAAVMAGIATIPSIIQEGVASPEDLLEIQLIENALREDLKPIEQAKTYRKLIETRGYTALKLSEVIYVSQDAISRALALLDLPESVQEQVEQGAIPPSVANEIAKLPQEDQEAVAARVVKQKMTRADVARTRAEKGPKQKKAEKATAKKNVETILIFRIMKAVVTIERSRGVDDAIAHDIFLALAEKTEGV